MNQRSRRGGRPEEESADAGAASARVCCLARSPHRSRGGARRRQGVTGDECRTIPTARSKGAAARGNADSATRCGSICAVRMAGRPCRRRHTIVFCVLWWCVVCSTGSVWRGRTMRARVLLLTPQTSARPTLHLVTRLALARGWCLTCTQSRRRAQTDR